MSAQFDQKSILNDLGTTIRIPGWAYAARRGEMASKTTAVKN